MRVIVDTEKCIGSGSCVTADPDVFDQREDDGSVILLAENPSLEHLDAVRKAERLCPAMAIVVEESAGPQ
jgi:ferredoxin